MDDFTRQSISANEDFARILRETEEKIGWYYDKDEIAKLREKVLHADPDARFCDMEDLRYACQLYGVDAETLLDDASLLEGIPTRQQMVERMMDYFHSVCLEKAPTPEQYIARITNRMIEIKRAEGKFPEFEGASPDDPTRLKILKRFVAGSSPKWKAFGKLTAIYDWAMDKMTPEEKKDYRKKSAVEQPVLIAKHLDDTIFSPVHLAAELTVTDMVLLMAKELQKLQKLTEEVPESYEGKFTGMLPPSEKDIPDVRDRLKALCASHGVDTGSNDVSLLNAVSKSLQEGILTENELVRDGLYEDLDKQFTRAMRRIVYRTQKRTASTPFKPAAELWKTDRRDARDKQIAPWELLRYCDKMAKGYFQTNSRVNRRNLYYYAILFDMSYDMGDPSRREDDRSDITKNLFHDFYCDNILRFLFDAKEGQTVTDLEAEPTGEGINYKNFVDVVYLYYLVNADRYASPADQIDAANQTIKACIDLRVEQQKNGKEQVLLTEAEYADPEATVIFRTKIGRALQCTEDELPAYLLEHYRIPTVLDDIAKMPEISYSSSANHQMNLLMSEIDNNWQEMYNEYRLSSPEESDADYHPRYIDDNSPLESYDVKEESSKNSSIWQLKKWYECDRYFNMQFAELLKKRYETDPAFIHLVEAISTRIDSFMDMIPRSELMALVLKTLYYADDPISNEDLRNTVGRIIGTCVDLSAIKSAIKRLSDMGFQIKVSTKTQRAKAAAQKAADQEAVQETATQAAVPEAAAAVKVTNQNDTVYILMNKESYADMPHLQPVMRELRATTRHFYSQRDLRVAEALKRVCLPDSKQRITRTRILTAVANLFMYEEMDLSAEEGSPFDDMEDPIVGNLITPKQLMSAFSYKADTILENANFQTLSSKNPFDLYLFLSILYYRFFGANSKMPDT